MEKYIILAILIETIKDRKTKSKESSYVASLFHKGENKIKEKIKEESLEVIEASKEEPSDHLLYELADLFFHSLVLVVYKNIELQTILNFNINDIKKEGYKNGISIIDDKLINEVDKLFSNQIDSIEIIIKNIILYATVIANYYNISIADIENELARREGTSGLVEKASRDKK